MRVLGFTELKKASVRRNFFCWKNTHETRLKP